ncbi:MAG: ABC transporter substrate-binding protein [Rhodospirillales bacterium]|nr:ABC transporter substrate-binding protein [Rhodospirillales bacterium]
MSDRENQNINKVKGQFAEGKLDRREFLRYSTLLGLSATAAYAFVGKVTGESFVSPAQASMPMGGTVRIGMAVPDLSDPHTFSWIFDSNITRNVVEYMTLTGFDNVTRPALVESWDASDDLRTWDMHVRDVKWHNGRKLTAEDLAWNINHVLDPATGSSVIGLMKGYMLEEYDTGEKKEDGSAMMSTRLWDANAIEVVSDSVLRLNIKEPNVAIPEHLFHYPFMVLDPEEGGKFKAGSNGTGAFDLVDYRVGESATLKARSDYWGEGPYIDELIFVDLGDDLSASIGALASRQIHGIYQGDPAQVQAINAIPHIELISASTGATAVSRFHVDKKPFDDARVRKAMRLAVDTPSVLEIAYQGLGDPGEHHHVSPVHPDYKKLTFMSRDVAAAKALLVEAGYPNGIDTEIAVNNNSPWEVNAVQAMVEQWKDADIRVKINVMPGSQFWDVWTDVPFGMTSWAHRPLGFMVLGLAYRTGVPWNESNYANPEFDALLSKAEGTLDIEKRREIIGQLETIMQEDGPIVQALWRNVIGARDKNLLGFEKHPTEYIFGNMLALKT